MLGTRPLNTGTCVDQPITGLPHAQSRMHYAWPRTWYGLYICRRHISIAGERKTCSNFTQVYCVTLSRMALSKVRSKLTRTTLFRLSMTGDTDHDTDSTKSRSWRQLKLVIGTFSHAFFSRYFAALYTSQTRDQQRCMRKMAADWRELTVGQLSSVRRH